jgi:hypothetical protein
VPEFGDRFENPVASADNPNQIGMFVRKVLRSGRVMNPGLFYEMTDGKGEFWLIKPDNLIPLDLPPRWRSPASVSPTSSLRSNSSDARGRPSPTAG